MRIYLSCFIFTHFLVYLIIRLVKKLLAYNKLEKHGYDLDSMLNTHYKKRN